MMWMIKKRVLLPSLLLFSSLVALLAFAPSPEDIVPNPVYSSLLKSLAVQGQLLQEEGEQRFSDWERVGRGDVETRTALLGIRQMQTLNKDLLSMLDRLFYSSLFVEKDGLNYAEENMAAIKAQSTVIEEQYLEWAATYTGSTQDPRYLALQHNLFISPIEEDFELSPLGLLQARVAHSQLQLAEWTALDVFVQQQGVRTVYWPFEALLMDWEQPPTYVGQPVKGRLLLGNFPPNPPPAQVAGQGLPKMGDDFYYEKTTTQLGKQSFEVNMRVENPLTGARIPFAKTVHYQVVPAQ